MTDEETLLAAGFATQEVSTILTDPKSRKYAEYILTHGSGPEDERALAVVRRLMGKVGE